MNFYIVPNTSKTMKVMMLLLATMFVFSFVSAEVADLGKVTPGQCITLTQSYWNSTYTNITQIQYPNQTAVNQNTAMVKTGPNYNYNFCDTQQRGQYIVTTCTDVDGVDTCVAYTFTSGTSNLILLIILLVLAALFFVATWVVNEEFFVYISGVLFLISGIYIMIYGIDIVSDMYSRAISFVTIGLGLLFILGAYIFNTSFKSSDEEEEEY